MTGTLPPELAATLAALRSELAAETAPRPAAPASGLPSVPGAPSYPHLPPDIAATLQAMRGEAAAASKPPATAAERARAMRERDAAEGRQRTRPKRPSRPRKPRPPPPPRPFVAIDGEGVTEGEVERFRARGSKGAGTDYQAAPHHMILLASSTGDAITARRGRLSMRACLDFLCDQAQANPRAIFVCYGGSYDVNQMLLYGLRPHALRHLARGNRVAMVMHGQLYRIDYRARKCLTVERYETDEIRTFITRAGNPRLERPQAKCVLWDVLGFFQSSFVKVMEQWLGEDHSDFQLIATMKAQRGEFTRGELADMTRYNHAECTALVAIMDKLRAAVEGLGLTLRRWDGAGAVASAMNSLHAVRDAKAEPPEHVFEAARSAFSGGHIEVARVGTFRGDVHHYDINSAYPDVLRRLPDLSRGVWQRGVRRAACEPCPPPPPGFTVVRVRYHFAAGMPFYPLFFRHANGSITYPQHGEGWYWWPEYEAAAAFFARFGGYGFDVSEWFHFAPASDTRPFAFAERYYEERKRMVALVKAGAVTGTADGWMKGGEYVIKLGINSLYGKTAQQLGGRGGPPPYFQLEWAGYTTAGCRAALMHAAMQAPDAIISFATDGLFSTAPLTLPCPADKVLGAWEYKLHRGMVVAMPGVYWLMADLADDPAACAVETDGRGRVTGAYSRGFDKDTMGTPELILRAWQAGRAVVHVPCRRLVTMGSAAVMGSATKPDAPLWRARGRFLQGTRKLDISGSSVKRNPPGFPVDLSRGNARTTPRVNTAFLDWLAEGSPGDDVRGCSAAYAIAWLDTAPEDEDGEDLDVGMVELREMMDADDNLW